MASYYDLIAERYDASRYLTPEVAERAATFLWGLVPDGRTARFLELGVGTGANIVPLVRRGAAVTGLDLSRPMMAQLRRKLARPYPNLTLIVGDATKLPFLGESYDLILTVHLLQSVQAWPEVLREVQRVLSPEGVYVYAEYLLPPHRRAFEAHYQAVARAHQPPAEPHAPPAEPVTPPATLERVAAHLRARGAAVHTHEVTRWTVSETVGELLEAYQSKAFGSLYAVPEAVFPEVMAALRTRCSEVYGSPRQTLSSEATYHAVVASRWPAP